MSTKLYYGARIREGVSAFDVLREVKAKLHPWLMRRNQQAWLETAISLLDTPSPGKKSPKNFHEAIGTVAMEEMKLKRQPDEQTISVNAEIVLLQHDPSGRLYAVYYGQESWDEFMKLDCVECEFGYWDNSDRPSSVSKAKWAARKRTWEETYDWNLPTASQGLTIQVLDEYEQTFLMYHYFVKVLPELDVPSLQERANQYAYALDMHEMMKDVKRSQMMSVYSDVKKKWRAMSAEERDARGTAILAEHEFPPIE